MNVFWQNAQVAQGWRPEHFIVDKVILICYIFHMSISAETLSSSILESGLDDYELDIIGKFLMFVTKKAEKGKFLANRIESGGVIEVEIVHYHGRRKFSERK